MYVNIAKDTKNIPMTKCHSDEAKTQKEIMRLCVWTKNARVGGDKYKI